MIGDFFIWCAGSDTNVLAKCEDSVRTKHIGLGTLVVIPAVVGFVSMTYALSTITLMKSEPYLCYIGGFCWSLIIFSFDRYIVSTHRKQQNNLAEFLNFTFYLRVAFAFVLGVVVSHPFVLLYFDGSITARIIKDRDDRLKKEQLAYQTSYKQLNKGLDDLYVLKRCNEKLLTAEQSGQTVYLDCGYSSGRIGNSIRAAKIEAIISGIDSAIKREENRMQKEDSVLTALKNSSQNNILENTSFDYLTRETTLEELKVENKIVGISELFLMLAFMLVDILPLMFKTFSPFSMYDKILYDDANILKEIKVDSRKTTLQMAYDNISSHYEYSRELRDDYDSQDYIRDITGKYNLSRNILTGLTLGILITIGLYFTGNSDLTQNQLFSIATIFTIVISIASNLITDLIKFIASPLNNEK